MLFLIKNWLACILGIIIICVKNTLKYLRMSYLCSKMSVSLPNSLLFVTMVETFFTWFKDITLICVINVGLCLYWVPIERRCQNLRASGFALMYCAWLQMENCKTPSEFAKRWLTEWKEVIESRQGCMEFSSHLARSGRCFYND